MYLNGESVVYGSTSSKVRFEPTIWDGHTVFNLCKYRESGTRRRIIQGESFDARFGFHSSKSGVGYFYNGWLTQGSYDRFFRNWVLSSQTADLYRANKQDFTTSSRSYSGSTRLTINQGYYSGETSDWACAEIIIMNKRISDNEILCIEDYLLDKYGLSRNETANINPGQCLNDTSKLVGWYDGDSFDSK